MYRHKNAYLSIHLSVDLSVYINIILYIEYIYICSIICIDIYACLRTHTHYPLPIPSAPESFRNTCRLKQLDIRQRHLQNQQDKTKASPKHKNTHIQEGPRTRGAAFG